MKATCLATLGALMWSGCGSGSPSAPSQNSAVSNGGFTISGSVYAVDATGGRPLALAGATVEFADSTTAAWGEYGHPVTDATGRYTHGPLTSRHYLARARKTGYTGSQAPTRRVRRS